MEKLYLPFTADIAGDQPISTSAIRRYWSRVLAAILNGDKTDTAYRLYEFLRSIAGKLAVDKSHVRNRQHGRFIFIDTVISGRAINEIFDAFVAYNLTDCHFLLLVDECGKRLKRQYATAIYQMVANNRATIINVDKIFTEDEGPAMSGIWTVTLPDLMSAALKIPNLFPTGEVAATLFYWEIKKRKDESNLAITKSNAMLNTLLYSAVTNTNTTSRLLEEFQTQISDARLQRQVITKAIAKPIITDNLRVKSIEVSSSHVIRGSMDKQSVDAVIRQFKETIDKSSPTNKVERKRKNRRV